MAKCQSYAWWRFLKPSFFWSDRTASRATFSSAAWTPCWSRRRRGWRPPTSWETCTLMPVSKGVDPSLLNGLNHGPLWQGAFLTNSFFRDSHHILTTCREGNSNCQDILPLSSHWHSWMHAMYRYLSMNKPHEISSYLYHNSTVLE